MAQFKCPQCGATVQGEPGTEAICGSCGFRAPVPIEAPAAPTVPPAPPATADAMSMLKSLHMWSYLLSVAAIGTFFLARFGLPFVLGVTGTGLGFMANVRDPTDRRGFLAVILGVVSLVLCALYLAIG